MGELTPRAGLYLPEKGEVVDVEKHVVNNFKIVDEFIKGKPVTTTTMPPNPVIGQRVYQTDTGFTLTWDGGSWQGRPWYIDRFVDTLTYWDIPQKAVVFGNTRRGDGNLASIGQPSDWGLADWEEDKADLKVPAGGLWHVQAELAFSGGASASREYRFDTQDEYLNTFSQGNGKGFLSGFVYLKKGSTVRLTCFQPGVPSNIAQDNRADPAGRSYLRMRYMGPEGIL